LHFSQNDRKKVWWLDATLLAIYVFYELRHTVYIRYKSETFTAFCSLLLLRKGISIGVPSRESNLGLPYSKPTHYYLSNAAPYLSNAPPYWSNAALSI
jgi:hypothetical protein